jgi:hypothetical protein
LGEVTRLGAHLLVGVYGRSAPPLKRPRVWRGPKTLGLRPINASSSRATRRSLLARTQGLVTLTAHAALPYGYPTTARPPVRQCRASRHQSEPGLAAGPIAVHVDRDHGSCLPLRRRTPKQNPRAIAFCLVPLAMTSQFRSLRNAGSPERQPSSQDWPPLRTGPLAVCCVGAWSKIKPFGLTGGHVDGR